jgi:c(7)-type cytochrome triheme protein
MKGGEKMRITAIMITLLVAVAFAGGVFAVPPGKNIDYAGGGAGKVVFDGKTHADKGLKCNDCHTKIWPMKKGMKMTMEEMNAGKYCGSCHNGEKAFSTGKADECSKCHKK